PARRLGGVEDHGAQTVVGHQRQQVLGARVAGVGERQRLQIGLAVVARLEVPLGAVVIGARRRRERGQRGDDQQERELSHGGTRDGPAAAVNKWLTAFQRRRVLRLGRAALALRAGAAAGAARAAIASTSISQA